MIKGSKFLAALFTIALAGALVTINAAQSPSKPQSKPSPVRPDQQTSGEASDEPDAQDEPETTREGLRRAITRLSDQIGLLTDEVKKLRKESERGSASMQLLLYEERLAKTEEKIENSIDRKYQLEAQEQELQRRMQNIQQELMMRNILRRSEAERAVRAELQDALEDNRKQQSELQPRIAELQTQAEWLRQRIEALRKLLAPMLESSPDQQIDK